MLGVGCGATDHPAQGNLGNSGSNPEDLKFLLDHVLQDSDFTCASVRNVWGYNGDPSASNTLQLISVPVNVQAIEGGRWDGSKFLTTTTTGETLHPYTLKNTPGGIKPVFTAFREYAIADYPYTAGDQVSIQSSEGHTFYMTAQNTASGSGSLTPPSFADIGTIINDDALTWYVNGLATIKGELLEGAATNYLLNSDSPATQTTASLGTGDYTLSVFGSGSAIATGGTATISGAAAATDGSPDAFSVDVAGTVTVTVTGSLDYFQLESGTFPSSVIITAASTVTRSATTLSDTTAGRLTAESGAGRICAKTKDAALSNKYIIGTIVDGSNYTGVYFSSPQVVLVKQTSAGTDSRSVTFTPTVGDYFCIDFYWDGSILALRAYGVGDTIPSFATSVSTKDAAISSDFELGSIDGINRSGWDIVSTELSTDKGDFGW